jgi:hypothetical protein
MGTSLYWEPVLKKKESKSLSNQLKYILAPTYWNHDGTLNGEEVYLTDKEINYLCGIRDGTRDKEIKESVEILINAIQKYGSVKIWLEN